MGYEIAEQEEADSQYGQKDYRRLNRPRWFRLACEFYLNTEFPFT